MSKAAVVIGVNRAGCLPVLDASSGARRISSWLRREDFHVEEFLDEDRSVVAGDIFDAVKRLVDRETVEQLVVYFSGHGFLNNSSEYWLLSEAPGDPNQAVNLVESVLLARECGIPNVVFISDACRSTPASLRAERVRGSLIFPNLRASTTPDAEVDRFLAALPGEPALEATVRESSRQHEGIFTTCFLAAFREPDPEMVRQVSQNGEKICVVPNRNLGGYLKREVKRKAQAKSIRLRQLPRSIVESGAHVYLGRARRARRPTPVSVIGSGMSAVGVLLGRSLLSASPAVGMSNIARLELARAASFDYRVSATEERAVEEATDHLNFDASVRLAGRREGPGHFETEMGFSVIGAEVPVVHGLEVDAELCSPGGGGRPALIRLHRRHEPMGSVLLRFADGGGTVLAGLEGYIGTVIVDAGRVVNVSYVPSDNSWRWRDYLRERERLERLRSVVAASARYGVFHVDRENAGVLADRIRFLKGVDPTLGLYAAYAYSNGGLRRQIQSVRVYMNKDLYGDLFDVAMLAGAGSARAGRNSLAPCCPMLSQGWSLLRVTDAQVSDAMREASYHLRPALWTTFDNEGMEIVLKAYQEGTVR